MRHLWSFLAGVVAAPLTWVLIALGQDGSQRTVTRWTELDTFTSANLIQSAVYLGAAGVLLGLLGTLRVSPIGPVVAGLLLAAPHVGLFFAPFAVHDVVPGNWKLFGDPVPLRQPLDNGTLFLIGVLLLVAVFSVQRWRRWPRPETAAPAPTSSSDNDPTMTNWPPNSSGQSERDTTPMNLGYPDPTPAPPLPRRDNAPGGSPWSEPPRTSTNRDITTD